MEHGPRVCTMSKRRRTKPRPRPTPTPERTAPAPASITSITATEEPPGTPAALDPAQVQYLIGTIATGILDEHLAAGHFLSVEDGMIAAICQARGAQLATRNIRDFRGLGVELINPWEHQN